MNAVQDSLGLFFLFFFFLVVSIVYFAAYTSVMQKSYIYLDYRGGRVSHKTASRAEKNRRSNHSKSKSLTSTL
jgi:hypothetical protein